MAKPPRPWIVAPHDPIEKLEPNLWTVDGDVPGVPFRRRMTIARRDDGRLVFYNAVPLREEAMADLAGWGKPELLVVPNDFHRLDAHAFRARLGVELVCAAEAAARVGKIAPVDARVEEIAADETIALVKLDGTKHGETAMLVRSGERAALAFADAFMNVPRATGLLTRLMRTAGGPKCPPLFRFMFMRDRRALRAHLERLADTPGLNRLLPSHGDIVDADAAGTLRRVAARDL